MLQRFLLVMLSVLAVLNGCRKELVWRPADDMVLVSSETLKSADLRMLWQINLPIKTTENVDRMFVFDKFLYVLTDRNYLFCIDRQKAAVRFSLQLTSVGLPVSGPSYYDGGLLFTVGSGLLVLDPVAGALTETGKLNLGGESAACPIVRNTSHIFAASANRRLYAIIANEQYQQDFVVTADNDSLINSVIADEQVVIFSTIAGNIVGISSSEPKKLWQRDITGSILAPIVSDDNWLYVGGRDTKLYKLDINSGTSGWDADFQTGQPLTTSAVIGTDVVYQYAGTNGLYAIDKSDGKMLWQVLTGTGLLAEKGSKAYVFAEPGVVVVIDNDTTEVFLTANLPDVSNYAVNTTDSQIYIADDRGHVAGLIGR